MTLFKKIEKVRLIAEEILLKSICKNQSEQQNYSDNIDNYS